MKRIKEKTRKLENKDGRSWDQPIARKFFRPMAIEIETGELLYGLVRAIKPTNAVETGTFEGFSAINIARALKNNEEGVLWTIDSDEYGAKKMFKDYNVKQWINQVIGLSPDSLEKIVSQNNIDFAFLDSAHTYNTVFSELEVLHRYFKIGSYITGHDYYRYGCIKQAVDDFVNKYPNMYEKVIIGTFTGFFILKKN